MERSTITSADADTQNVSNKLSSKGRLLFLSGMGCAGLMVLGVLGGSLGGMMYLGQQVEQNRTNEAEAGRGFTLHKITPKSYAVRLHDSVNTPYNTYLLMLGNALHELSEKGCEQPILSPGKRESYIAFCK